MNELYLLDLKNKQSTLEWINACANRDITQFGQWSCDYPSWQAQAQKEFDEAREKYMREIIKL